MNFLAVPIARNIWGAMLWFMRRKWMRRLQRASVRLFPEGSKRDRAWENFRRRERFARRYGLRILTAVVTLCLYSLALMFVFQVTLFALEQGWISRPGEQRAP